MKKKIVLIIIFLSMSVLCLGGIYFSKLYQNTNNYDKKNNVNNKNNLKNKQEEIKIQEANPTEIVVKQGIIEDSIEVLGVKDSKNFYGYKTSGELCVYNTDTKETKLFKKAVGKDMYIQTVSFSDKWIVWVEGSDKEKNNLSDGKGWVMYGENIETGEVFIIDKDRAVGIDYIPIIRSPQGISIEGDNIVYSNVEVDNKKQMVSVIKLVNIKERKTLQLDKIYDINSYSFSSPDIDGSNIVWGINKIMPEGKLTSNIILYNAITEKREVISENTSLYAPVINKNFIVANLKLQDYNNIAIYDLNDRSKGWENYVTGYLPVYNNELNTSIEQPLFSEDYMIWWDNTMKGSYVINTKHNKVYTLDKSESMQVRGIYNKIAFWKEFIPNQPDKTITKYAILK